MAERKTHRGEDGLLYDEDGFLVYEGSISEEPDDIGDDRETDAE